MDYIQPPSHSKDGQTLEKCNTIQGTVNFKQIFHHFYKYVRKENHHSPICDLLTTAGRQVKDTLSGNNYIIFCEWPAILKSASDISTSVSDEVYKNMFLTLQ